MFLHRLYLNPRSKEARRDISDPYQMHSTLCRAFSDKAAEKCPEGAFLWRLEPTTTFQEVPCVLVQSTYAPRWSHINIKDWFEQEPDPGIDLAQRLNLDELRAGQRFRYRLRANPCVTQIGKRLGLFRTEDQEKWIERKGNEQHGYTLPKLFRARLDLIEEDIERIDVSISQEQMLQGRQHKGNCIRVFSVLYDGFLIVSDPEKFKLSIQSGIGHGKALGLGLFSVVPV